MSTSPKRRSGWPRSTAWRSPSIRPASSRTTRSAAGAATPRPTSTPGTRTCPAGPGTTSSTRSAREPPPGSTWNFESGYKQDRQPNINSEFGNVWGYEGSTGDVDWSWDYHRAVNAFRRHPKVAGWLYTEHHDVINEWNGYWRFDRSEKLTGLEDLAPGMTLRGPARAALRRRGHSRRPEPLGEGGRNRGGAALGLLPDRRARPSATRSCCRRGSGVGHAWAESRRHRHDSRDRGLSPLDVRGARRRSRCRCRRSREWPSSPWS